VVNRGSHPEYNRRNSKGQTGFVGGVPNGSLPDGGATVMLLGMAFGTLGMVRRYLIG